MKNNQFQCLLVNHHLRLLLQSQVVLQNKKVISIKLDIIKSKEKIILYLKKVLQSDHVLIAVAVKKRKQRCIHILKRKNSTIINLIDLFKKLK